MEKTEQAQPKRDLRAVAWAMLRARSPDSSLQDLLFASQLLVAYGLAGNADMALQAAGNRVMGRRGPAQGEVMRVVDQMSAINRSFREARIAPRISTLGDLNLRLLDGKADAVLHHAPDSTILLVVFASMFNDFWVSFPVLHCLLPSERISVLYLKDPRDRMYMAGIPAYGATFADLCAGVRDEASRIGIDDLRVMGFSSGGYPALLFAHRSKATAYLGLSIRTDVRRGSPLPTERYIEREDVREAAGDLMTDLKPLLAASPYPERAIIYYGDSTVIDSKHALHLADLPNFTLRCLPGIKHNTVAALLAGGEFKAAVTDLLA